MRITFPIIALIAALLLAAVTAAPTVADEPQGLSAKDLLDRMAKAYAECKSYRDSGVVKTVIIRPTTSETEERPFTTAFVRPDRFRFEFRETDEGKVSRFIVWRRGREVRTLWDAATDLEPPKSFGLAIAGAAGVSGGSAHTVPTLLVHREIGGWQLTELEQAKRIADAKLGAIDCFRIEGQNQDTPMTVWIDQKTFLVRRIDERDQFDGFRTEDTTTYDPIINEDIPDEKLAFDPPAPK